MLVSAPTGSGKTLIANYAIGRIFERGERAFYTTPLKALSNQKYGELCALYGERRVGLLTGDVSINASAEVVVMTTEVLRNMLLTESHQLNTLGLVVLDEVHYLQDPFRGRRLGRGHHLTPAAVRFVALSATIGNANFIGEWFAEVRGPTAIIVENERPIQLHNHLAVMRRGQSAVEIVDLLDGQRLSDEARRIDNLMKATRKFRPGPKWKGPKTSAPPPPFRAPRRSELLHALERDDLLPVIVFIFSRAACDDAAHQCRRDGLMFTTPEERRDIEAIAQSRLVDFRTTISRRWSTPTSSTVCGGASRCTTPGWCRPFARSSRPVRIEPARRRVRHRDARARREHARALGRAGAILEVLRAGRKFLTSAEYSQMTGRAGRGDSTTRVTRSSVSRPRSPWSTSDVSHWPRRRTCTRLFVRPTTSPPT